MVKLNWFYFIVIISWFFNSTCRRVRPTNIKPVFSSNLSFTENPAYNWQVGYSIGDILDTAQFRLCTFADTTPSIPLWHPEARSYYPYIGQNRTSQSLMDVSNRWALKAGQIAMEGSNSGQYSMLRFVAPITGTFHVRVVFEGVHFGLSTTDVHVLLNAKELFRDVIDGYGGDSTFHIITGSHPTATFEKVLSLKKNDLLTFAVGFGSNKNHYDDTTGLQIMIEAV